MEEDEPFDFCEDGSRFSNVFLNRFEREELQIEAKVLHFDGEVDVGLLKLTNFGFYRGVRAFAGHFLF